METYNRVSPAALEPRRGPAKHWEVFDMADDTANPLNVPYGYCHCGCGQKTKITSSRNKSRFVEIGQPNKYLRGHFKKGKTTEQRFWEKVTKTDSCWIWTAGRSQFGYGRFHEGERPNRRQVMAHRFSWEMAYGPIPEGLLVLHKCDNPPCVRPDHLFLGTDQDNMTDMVQKGRQRTIPRVGEKNGRAKLTLEQVREIRSIQIIKKDPECGFNAIGRRYGVSHQQIRAIVRGSQWHDHEAELVRQEAAE